MTASKKHILIVDDDVKLCNIISEILEDQGHIVHCLNDGLRVLKFIHSNQVDIFILDMHMPGINGFDLITQLETSAFSGHAIILTALVLDKTYRHQLNARGFRILEKPVSIDELFSEIQHALKFEFNELYK